MHVFKGFRHSRRTRKHKSRIPCPIFGESRFPGNSQIPDPVNIFIVFPIPAPYFGQIPNPENTLPDPVSRRGCAMTVKKCTKKHDAHAKLTILLITAYLLFAILVAIFFDAYAHLKMFKPLELFGILHIQLWAKS